MSAGLPCPRLGGALNPQRLVWGLIVGLAGILFLAGCLPSGAGLTPTPIPTFTPQPTASPSASPTVTHTPTTTRTPDPTQTLTPTVTPSPTSTPTPPPTLTAAVPLVDNNIYNLRSWDPFRASHLIELLENYPNVAFRTRRDEEYYQAFRYAALVQKESLLRFPDVFQTAFWRLDLAYNLARSGDPQAGRHYADLILDGFRNQNITIEELNGWFFKLDPRVVMRPVQVEPPPGIEHAYLVEVRTRGSSFILIYENNGVFNAHVLTRDFDFANPAVFDFFVEDLTGDDLAEIGIYVVNVPGRLDPALVQIFDLSQTPPRELPFREGEAIRLNLEHESRWLPTVNPEGDTDLQFRSLVFPACPVEVSITYRWTGAWFAGGPPSYDWLVEPDLAALCDPALDHIAAHWGMEALIQLLEPGLAFEEAPARLGFLPPDIHDKWRLRLGLAYALEGEQEAAVGMLLSLVDEPAQREGTWQKVAEDFVGAYTTPLQIYEACTVSDLCDLKLAIMRLVADLPLDSYDQVVTQLQLAQVPIRASGEFDFEGDGDPERWFTVRLPGRILLDLGVAIKEPLGIATLFLDTVDRPKPEFRMLEAPVDLPVVQLANGIPFTMARQPETRRAAVLPYTERGLFAIERVQLTVENNLQALLAGSDPRLVQLNLLQLEASPTFLCPYYYCSEFIYAIGLASELARDERQAVDRYLELWRSYSRIPYTTIARLKLEGLAVEPTATMTPTRTETPTPTITFTPDPNASPTPSLTPDPNATPTATPTITISPTVTASPTTTVTPSATP